MRQSFLQRRFADAVASFERALSVDPEDLQAHYNLMVCYQGLGQPALAAREQALYERFTSRGEADYRALERIGIACSATTAST